MSELLQCCGLSKSFGSVTVADDISFSISKGEAVGIIGPNGAGKTSLFNLVTGTMQPDSGNIHFQHRDITKLSSASRCHGGIARSFQIPQPFSAMSVYENALVAASHGARLPMKKAESQCIDALRKTGLLDQANTVAGSLTLLERKRLELTRALASNPALLLLDEIAGGLTDKECQSLIETIQSIRREGVTIIWIEHIVHALLAVVDRLIVLDFGKVIADGEPTSVMASKVVQENYMGIAVDA